MPKLYYKKCQEKSSQNKKETHGASFQNQYGKIFFSQKYDSSRCFSSGSLAVFIGAAPPPFGFFAGGFPRRLRRRNAFELFLEYSIKIYNMAQEEKWPKFVGSELGEEMRRRTETLVAVFHVNEVISALKI